VHEYDDSDDNIGTDGDRDDDDVMIK